MANKCEKISQAEQDKLISYRSDINLYNAFPLPQDAGSRKEQFAERLQSQMKVRNMTKAELSKKSGASATTITKLINRAYDTVSWEHIYLFAAILGCTPHYLVGLVDSPGETCSADKTQKGFFPITFWVGYERAIIESFKEAAREDKVFADYMYQIVKGGPDKMEKAKEVLEQMGIVEPREPDRVEYEKYLF